MSVYKPKNSPYFHFDFVWQGRRVYGSTGLKTKRQAERYEERERNKLINGGTESPPITLDEAAGLYEDKVSDLPSWKDAERTIEAMLNGLGADRLLSEITQLDLIRLVASRRAGRANSSVNREIEVWRAIWRNAQDAGMDVGQMPKWGKLFLKVPTVDPRELAADEEAALFEEIRIDLYAFCEFALKSGWRMSEVMNLRWVDCQLGEGVATTRIKGGDVIKRPLTSDMVILIANQPKVGPHVFTYVAQRTKPAFVDKRGRKHPARLKGERYKMTKTVLRRPWAAAKEAAGIENFRFHDLRHTRGTRILRTTGNLKAAQRALGHRSIKTTLRYAHATDDDVRAALDASESRTIPEIQNAERKKA